MERDGPAALVDTIVGGRYRLLSILGDGAMGTVFLAEHVHMHKRFAIKVLHPETNRIPEVIARFEREAESAGRIDQPNVAAATDFGQLDDGTFFLVLEYVEGRTLRQELRSEKQLDLSRAIPILTQIARALERAHHLGIVHRDLKPENVMLVAREGEPELVKVLDFGIAKVRPPAASPSDDIKTALTEVGMVFGTPEYLAPEQALGQTIDGRADLYALGIIAYEMLTGTRPFQQAQASQVSLLLMHISSPVPPMRQRSTAVAVPSAVEAIVLRLLEKKPERRFSNAHSLIEALELVESAKSKPRRRFPLGSSKLTDTPRRADPPPASPPRARYVEAAPLAPLRPAEPLSGPAARAVRFCEAPLTIESPRSSPRSTPRSSGSSSASASSRTSLPTAGSVGIIAPATFHRLSRSNAFETWRAIGMAVLLVAIVVTAYLLHSTALNHEPLIEPTKAVDR